MNSREFNRHPIRYYSDRELSSLCDQIQTKEDWYRERGDLAAAERAAAARWLIADLAIGTTRGR